MVTAVCVKCLAKCIIYALSSVKFLGLKLWLCKKKRQISGMENTTRQNDKLLIVQQPKSSFRRQRCLKGGLQTWTKVLGTN